MSSLFQRHSTLLTLRQRALIALASLALFSQLFVTADAADVQSNGDIVVVAVHGDVQATMVGITSPLYAGAILQLPATIRSGSDGAVELRQGPTTIAAAANTELEIPQSAEAQGLLERVVQIRGNAFYSVGKRERTRLRVETPYLVAVIKGTQFNVATQDDATTIALFEGRLEIRAADESDVVDLHAGEIAIRHRNDPSITVLRMTAVPNDGRRRQNDSVGASASDATSDAATSGGLSLANSGDSRQQVGEPVLSDAVTNSNPGELSATSGIVAQAALTTDNLDAGIAAGTDLGNAKAALQVDTGLDAVNSSVGAGADIGASIDLGGVNIDASIGASVDLGGVSADVGIDANVGGAAVAADIGTSVDLGAGNVTANTSASLDLGSISAGVSADAGVDLPGGTIDANVGAGVAAGVASADLDVGASAGLGGVAVTADTGADLAVATVDAGAGAAIDLGSTPAVSVDANLDVGAGDLVAAGVTAGVSDTTAGLDANLDVGGTAAVDAAIDIPAGDVSANVDVGGIVDVGVDLGTGTINLNIGGSDTGGGLLGGLLNRRSKN